MVARVKAVGWRARERGGCERERESRAMRSRSGRVAAPARISRSAVRASVFLGCYPLALPLPYPFPILSRPILSCPVLSCPVLSVLSYPSMSLSSQAPAPTPVPVPAFRLPPSSSSRRGAARRVAAVNLGPRERWPARFAPRCLRFSASWARCSSGRVGVPCGTQPAPPPPTERAGTPGPGWLLEGVGEGRR
ncbi:hypothetical protein BJ546DRAFT_967245 [Cryomyces antarcticus]